MHLSIIPDLASWSPCPSWPSEPRPQLHTSVSRDGSPSMATSSPAAWVWPPGDGLQAHGRCRRGDPERRPQNLKEASCYQRCFFESTSRCDMLRTWQICMIHTITFNKSYSRQKKNKHVFHTAPRPEQLWSVLFTFYMGKHTFLWGCVHKQVWCAHTLIKTFKALRPWNNHERPEWVSSCERMNNMNNREKEEA